MDEGLAGARYLRTALLPLDQLMPYPGNAKRGDVDAIRASLRKNGQYRSLVVRAVPDGPLIVLAGNHTMLALAAEGREDARCEVIECDDATARRINLADNKIPELGDYDDDALAELLSHLDEDYRGTGYSDADVQRIVHAVPHVPEAPEDFPSFDEGIDTEYRCPKCSYEWSGKPR
ncbi:ParB/RepB/Spo0J family partition protein [Streptomyces sp. NPDC001404]|uniref:ParB/RepB/Spo0J family partition protein n=1 Tax=Streptomyces sp. NPDC001404 TaxID=3364571 RepID=UPI003692AE90